MSQYRPVLYGRTHAVSSGHALATHAAAEILRDGGNAIDAGVAAGIALGVLESELVSIAGVAPIILYSAEHDHVVTISGVGNWPALTNPEVFVREHDGKIPVGVLRTVVPAAPDAWITALNRYGTMNFDEVAHFAIDFAANGFHMYPLMAELIGKNRSNFERFASNAEIYLPDGDVPKVGELFLQTDLARSLQFMADEARAGAKRGGRRAGLAAARDAFYRGDLARAILAHQQAEGGWLRADDLEKFHVDIEEPLQVVFRGVDVYGCGAWCQGPLLLEMLKILEPLDLPGLGHNSADYLHVLAETIKLGAADRERFLGDPRQVDVPLAHILSDGFAAQRRACIDMTRATPAMPDPGDSPAAEPPVEGQMDTSYVCVVDRVGNVFSATPSDSSYNVPVVPGLGFVVSGRGSQSWVDTSHPSAVAPGRRPRLTPNPALAMTAGTIIPFGSPGGDVQTQAMLQVLLNRLVFGMDVQSAVDAPRIASYSFPSSFAPHESEPGVLRVEARIAETTRVDLAGRGHLVVDWPDSTWLAGSVSMIAADRTPAITLRAAADHRRAGYAQAW
ncbi:gamma-glutamyltransferase family protein [Natronohydrobacter thiooxidans]|uniref:gamma-glutamyltransferase family protein n=1 Tax=Natronohydrobacter thiooxidans TaxID=87172 RepID=UPI0008FF5D1A|nr:gamma-glutamyltransferase [Natronohydrobacter thiooxidans]